MNSPHETAFSVFFIGVVCVGLPCLIWAFYSVHRLRKAKGGISAFIILLLLTDLLQLILYPYIVTLVQTPSPYYDDYGYFYNYGHLVLAVSGCLKMCSLHLHQLVALEGVLTVKYPTISAGMFSFPCYIMVSIIILLIPVICFVIIIHGVVYDVFLFSAIGLILALMCLLVVTGILVCKAPPTAANTPFYHRPGLKVFVVSLVTLFALYLPCVLVYSVHILLRIHDYVVFSWIVTVWCLLSLTVISDPLLCVLVCRENLSAETERTQIEVNDEETLM